MVGPTTVFDVRGVSKHFGGIAALSDVGFSVRAGEVLGLIGPNGAGKTTLFECLAGLLPVDEGAIYVEDRVVSTERRKAMLFYVPDAIAPWPSESVRWALEYAIGFFRGPATVRPIVIEALFWRLAGTIVGTTDRAEPATT